MLVVSHYYKRKCFRSYEPAALIMPVTAYLDVSYSTFESTAASAMGTGGRNNNNGSTDSMSS